MILEKPKQWSLKRLLLWLAVLIVIVVLWDRWNGALAVMSLCERDGGERIFETANARGLLVEDSNLFCQRCIELIGSRKFEYIDARIEREPSRRFPVGSYVRYTVGAQGDADCEAWPGWKTAEITLRRAGIEENECVRIQLLPGKPTGYALLNSRREFIVRGATIGLNEWRIEQMEAALVLARLRNYHYTSKLTAVTDMSGHGGNPDEACMNTTEYVKKLASLNVVLRDFAKQPSN